MLLKFFSSPVVKLEIQEKKEKPQLSRCHILSDKTCTVCWKDLRVYSEPLSVGANPWEAQSLSKLSQASEQFYEVYKSRAYVISAGGNDLRLVNVEIH